jgi:hypothetical protein
MIMTADDRTLLQISPAYLAELRKRVTAVGVQAVADKAGMSRTALWAALKDRKPDAGAYRGRASYRTVDRARLALAALSPDDDPMPPPFVAVDGPRSPSWRLARAAMRPTKRR